MKLSDNQGVVLGLAGDLIFDSEKLTHRHNKAGGRPVFAGMTPPLELQDVVCRVCGSTLALVVQVCNSMKVLLFPMSMHHLLPISKQL